MRASPKGLKGRPVVRRITDEVKARLTPGLASAEAIQTVLDAAPVPMIVTQEETGDVIYANNQASELLGKPVGELVGQNAPDFYYDPSERAPLLEALNGEEVVIDRELRIRDANGQPRWMSVSLVRRDLGGESVIISGLYDIDRRRRMEIELRATHDQLAQADARVAAKQTQLVRSEKLAALGSLIAGISHEIKTPVSAICSMNGTQALAVKRLRERLEALIPEQLASDKKLRAALSAIDNAHQVIEEGSGRVGELVKRLGTFARDESEPTDDVDIHDCLQDTLMLLSHELKRDVEVVREFGTIPTVRCVSNRINQVFLNVIMNARQAIDGTGRITIRTKTDGPNVSIEVEDTGSGIAAEHLEKVFAPGFTTKCAGMGTGLGLPISREIVQQHGGSLTLSSEVGKGTTVSIVLPVAGRC